MKSVASPHPLGKVKKSKIMNFQVINKTKTCRLPKNIGMQCYMSLVPYEQVLLRYDFTTNSKDCKLVSMKTVRLGINKSGLTQKYAILSISHCSHPSQNVTRILVLKSKGKKK